MLKVMFTGEKGNLAREITKKLHEKQYEVVQAVVNTCVSTHHQWPELDIARRDCIEVIKQVDPDIIIHSAAIVNTDKCQGSPARCVETNVLGTHYVLEAAETIGAKLIYFSTTATYDPDNNQPRPFSELSAQRPPTLYGITKYAGELLVHGNKMVSSCIIRPCFIYGDPPYDHSSQLVRVAVHSALKKLWPQKVGPTPEVTLDPMMFKDYMRVEDFAEAVIQIMEHRLYGEIFNVAYGAPRLMGQYFADLEKLLGFKLDMYWVPELDYMGDHIVNPLKLKRATLWEPKITPEIGIAITAKATIDYVSRCLAMREEPLYK